MWTEATAVRSSRRSWSAMSSAWSTTVVSRRITGSTSTTIGLDAPLHTGTERPRCAKVSVDPVEVGIAIASVQMRRLEVRRRAPLGSIHDALDLVKEKLVNNIIY